MAGSESSGGVATDRGIKRLFSRRHKAGSRERDKTEDGDIFWPLDLLPQDCPNARIITWGYDSKVSHFFRGAANQSNIAANARNLLAALRSKRVECVRVSALTWFWLRLIRS